MHPDDRVFDLAAAAAALREECVYAFAVVAYARRTLRGRKVPLRIRRLLADAERAAESARQHARRLDEMMACADAAKRAGRPS